MKVRVNGKNLKIEERGVRYGGLFAKWHTWTEWQSWGFYLEKVKVRGVHYMNFSTTPYLTTADDRQNVYVLWVWFDKSPGNVQSPAAFRKGKRQGNCLLIPLWKRQILPQTASLGEQAERIQQAVFTYAPNLTFCPVNQF